MTEDEAQKRLELFAPYGKRRWKVMPMGDLNADIPCVEMTTKPQMEWDKIDK